MQDSNVQRSRLMHGHSKFDNKERMGIHMDSQIGSRQG